MSDFEYWLQWVWAIFCTGYILWWIFKPRKHAD